MAEWKCQDCGKVFKTQQDLLAHELEHAPAMNAPFAGRNLKRKRRPISMRSANMGGPRPPIRSP